VLNSPHRGATLFAVQAVGIVYVLLFTAMAGAVSKERITQTYSVAPYERLDVRGAVDVRLVQVDLTAQNSSGSHLEVQAAGSTVNLASLSLESVDGTLYIDGSAAANDIEVTLPVERLSEVVSDGAGHISGSGLRQAELVLDGSGAGRFSLNDLQVDQLIVNGAGSTEFSLSGFTRLQVVEMIGLSRYDAHALTSETSHIEVRGACHVDVWVNELLDVLVYGVARIRYGGDPMISQEIMGAGRVDRL